MSQNMKLMIGTLFISLVMFVVAIAYAAVLTTLTLLFTTRQKSTLRLPGLTPGVRLRVDTERRL